MIMEFEEMQKVWDSQRDETLFVLNTKAMHNRILAKMKSAHKITNVSELVLILVNIAAGSFIFLMDYQSSAHNIYMRILSIWMVVVAACITIARVMRMRGENNFERTMLGDLSYARSTADYQVKLSQIMRWNIVPVAFLCVLGMWHSNKSPWIIFLLLLVFSVAHFASRWEHSIYKSKKRELDILQKKLMDG